MRAKIRKILEECIENGLQYGMMRAHKYTDDPGHDYLIDEMDNAIWLEIDERFDFDHDLCDEVVEGFDHLEKEREWVGLTQEELQDLCVKSYHTDNAGKTHFNRGYFADAIEAKLKEKNT